MKFFLCILSFFLVSLSTIESQQIKIWNETEIEKTERMQWWTDARFGMFIHMGLYSLPARHEWVKRRERMSDEQYQKYFDHFNPDLFDPHKWARTIKKAGMKYAIFTTKHHDGFCMYDSKYTEYKITNTPYGKDITKELVDAFRKEGIKIGFYYSLLDWHHPHFTIDFFHSIQANNKKEYDALNKERDMAIYRSYMKNQVKEILTNYGKIDILWLDFSYPEKNPGKGREDWGSIELVKMVRELQPEIILDNRTDLDEFQGAWDFATPEGYKVEVRPTLNGKNIPWEVCHNFSGSWGYFRDLYSYKNTKQLLGLLIGTVSKGGNLLLNIGPNGRGEFDNRDVGELEAISKWMKYNSRSIYECTEAPSIFQIPKNTELTYNPKTNRLYIHLIDYPVVNLKLVGYEGKVKYAQFLHDASEIKITNPERLGFAGDKEVLEGDINLILPQLKPDVEIPVIELFLK